MEHESAKPEDIIESSLKMVRESAAYFCLVSFKYGQIPQCPLRNPHHLSITELEFYEAQKLNRPIYLFIMSDDHLVKAKDIESDPHKADKLKAFRQKAKNMESESQIQRIYADFNCLEEFYDRITTSLSDLVERLSVKRSSKSSGKTTICFPSRVEDELITHVPKTSNRISLLIVEDEQPLARRLSNVLDSFVDAMLAFSMAEARAKLNGRAFDAVLLDLQLPDGNGMDLLREIAEKNDDTAVIIFTSNADLNSAIQAVRYGAYDYLIKPCRVVELEQQLERIRDQRCLRDENTVLKRQTAPQKSQPELIGESDALQKVRKLVAKVAPSNTSVLITGETGAGKEATARIIHKLSNRRNGPFIPVNFAALPKELVESELFGHRKGAITGAIHNHRGLVQAGTGGTLFLDEIGDLPIESQAKFLRLLESNEARRVGDTDSYLTDIRVIAATNRDLRKDVAAGRFRMDLFYRLATVEILLPPLRAISNDIAQIARHILGIISMATTRDFSDAALKMMQQYAWPGNVRELRNVIERAVILSDKPIIEPEALFFPADG